MGLLFNNKHEAPDAMGTGSIGRASSIKIVKNHTIQAQSEPNAVLGESGGAHDLDE